MDMKNELFQLSRKRAVHTVWIMSDLQMDRLEDAAACLDVMRRDFLSLDVAPEAIWYLGDATQKFQTLDEQRAMVRMQCDVLSSFGLPVCFVMGNHDTDYVYRSDCVPPVLPMWEEARRRPGWRTVERMSDCCFRGTVGEDWAVYFFSDHVDEDRAWMTKHGEVRGSREAYPYGDDYLRGLRERIASEERPVIIASHYAFVGGNRPSALQSRLMPLPPNVRMVFYGHAHISDLEVCYESAYKRIGWVDWHDIPQYDVACMENARALYGRSVILHLYEDLSAGVFWRNHSAGRFEECYFSSPDSMREGLTDYLSTHPGFRWYGGSSSGRSGR